MEAQILSDLNPASGDLYLAPLRGEGLRVFAKESTPDGWSKSIDLFLVCDTPEELRRARRVIQAVQK